MRPADSGWGRTPLEFVGVPAGSAIGDTLIGLVLHGKACPDCIPAAYSLRYGPQPPGMAPSDPRAWQVTVTHDPSCPGPWLRESRQ